jgi:fucose permease
MITFLTVTGFGLSLHFPFGIERSIKVSAGRADKATTRIAIATAISSGIAPFSIGLIADQIGVAGAFLVVPASLLVAFTVAISNPVK